MINRRLTIPLKDAPDGMDRRIAALIAEGWTPSRIARFFECTMQSIGRRVQWMKAERWMSLDDTLLDSDQRDRLIKIERAFMEAEKTE